MKMKTLLSGFTLILINACGNKLDLPSKSESLIRQNPGSDASFVVSGNSALDEFVAQLEVGLGFNQNITSASEKGALEGVYAVVLAEGKQLKIRRHSKLNGSLAEATFSDFTTERVEPARGVNAACLKQGLGEAKAAGYKTAYVGILFSDTTMFFGYGHEDNDTEMLTFDLATGECYVSWRR